MRKLSLGPRALADEQMSQNLDHHDALPNAAEYSLQQVNGPTQGLFNAPRLEALRHVFPYPTRGRLVQQRKATTSRIVKRNHRNTVSSRLPNRPRAFHKYITSLFGNGRDRDVMTRSPQPRSRTSSIGSRLGSSAYGSVPSLDVVSPATFMFSGPVLHSAASDSHSTSRLPSLRETSSEIHLLRRPLTDSFSILEQDSIIDEEVLEPIVKQGPIRTVSDILLGPNTRTQIEEVDGSLLLRSNHSELLPKSFCQEDGATRYGAHTVNPALGSKTVCYTSVLVALLAPYLDMSAWQSLRMTNRA